MTYKLRLNQKKLRMKKIMAIDYGRKRTGIAVTDDLQLIASGLTTVDTQILFTFLEKYFLENPVEKILVGLPVKWDGSPTDATPLVEAFIEKFSKTFPTLPIKTVDERFTSKIALQSLIESGVKKKKRQNKALVDEVSATLMLQEYLAGNNS